MTQRNVQPSAPSRGGIVSPGEQSDEQNEEAHDDREDGELEVGGKAVNQGDGGDPDDPVGEKDGGTDVHPEMAVERGTGARP